MSSYFQGHSSTPVTAVMRPEDWSLTSKLALASIGSQGTMGGLLLAGMVLLLIHFVTNMYIFDFILSVIASIIMQ